MATSKSSHRPTTTHNSCSNLELATAAQARVAASVLALLLSVGCDDSKCGSGADVPCMDGPNLDAGADGGIEAGPGVDSPSETADSSETTASTTGSAETTDESLTTRAASDPSETDPTAADVSTANDANGGETSASSAATSLPASGPSAPAWWSSSAPSSDSHVDSSASTADTAASTANDTASLGATGGGTGGVATEDAGNATPDTQGNAYPTDEDLTDDTATGDTATGDAATDDVATGDAGPDSVLNCGGANARDTLPITESGWVLAECNDGIQGGWYCYDDGVNPSGCEDDQVPFDAEQAGMCLEGVTTLDEDFVAWGAGLGLTLNDGLNGPQPWNAAARNIIGFKVVITGDSGGLSLRLAFTNSSDPDVIPPMVYLPGPGEYEVHFDDVAVPDWDFRDPGALTDPTAIYDVQLEISGGVRYVSYAFCLTELTPIYDN